MLDDMVTDLEPYSVYEIERSVAAWRTSSERMFPNSSGQLIAKIMTLREESIARGRAHTPLSLPPPTGKYPSEHRPWREVLAHHGRTWDEGTPLAKALDSIQGERK